MNQTLNLEITQERIDKGGRGAEDCPIWWALVEECPALQSESVDIKVFNNRISIYKTPESSQIEIPLSPFVQDWIHNHDIYKLPLADRDINDSKTLTRPEPFEFEIELPEGISCD